MRACRTPPRPRWSSSGCSRGRTCTSPGRRQADPRPHARWPTCPTETALRFARRIGLAQRPAGRARDRVPAAVRGAGGGPAGAGGRRRGGYDAARRPGPADRRPAPARGRLPVAATATAPQALGRAVAAVLDALPGADVDDGRRAGRPSAVAPAEPGPRADAPSRRRIPVVAVTGTNGKTTTSRMIAHIARAGGQHVGWSSTDGIYVDGELVEAGDYSGPERRRPGARPPGGRARGHRDRARRHPAQGHRADPQRRLRRDQRHRRPPRPAGHRHPRPARRGQGGRPADHPQATAGRCSTATTRGSSRCARSISARPWVFSRDPDSPAIREVLDRRRPGHDGDRRLGLGARARTPTPTRSSSWSTCR